MKVFWHLTAFALIVLSAAAVWLGGLNQDEGWYLYAANLVAEGQMPYRDFFYTQAPLMPIVYSAFSGIWARWGILGGRLFTLAMGLAGIVFIVGFARRVASPGRRGLAALLVAIVLCGNLYHIYYLAIPKTYALASLFVAMGFYLLTFEGFAAAAGAGTCLAFACATRVSLGAILPVAAAGLFFRRAGASRARLDWLWFGLSGALVGALVFCPFLTEGFRHGFVAAQQYHAARGGFDVVFTVGSVSRLVRWYLPVFVLLGLGVYAAAARPGSGVPCAEPRRRLSLSIAVFGFAAVFLLQMLAPFPYEDYNVPVMGLLAAVACVMACDGLGWKPVSLALATLGMTWAGSFGSPLLQEWMTNGQDRFWVHGRSRSALAQLRDVAREINELDPGGGEILTQDLYLAVETGRKVPRQLAMGPFSYWSELPYPGAERVLLDDSGMRKMIEESGCKVAAMSGYAFAITAPRCEETSVDVQIMYWNMLKRRYDRVLTEENFGQGRTPLIVMTRKDTPEDDAGSPVR